MNHLHNQANYIVVFIFTFLCSLSTSSSAQDLLSPQDVPKFVNPLPVPSVIDARAGGTFNVTISQFEQDLGLGLNHANGEPVLTKVWGYNGQYPGPSFVTMKNVPVQVYWRNYLTSGANGTGAYLEHLLPVDVSIHWALRDQIGDDGEEVDDWESVYGVPIVTHLHGGHTESASDGLPEAWYTPLGGVRGPHFVKGENIPYYYHNDQEAATLWYHDHALGITRLNVYAGLAGFYLLTDENEQNLKAANILPADKYDIGLAIQDRMFTTDGQLYYPSEAEGEMHGVDMDDIPVPSPSILPEFFGDIILVNGKAWPKLEVEPREYRFRLLNGSDSRFYNVTLTGGAVMWQIGSDNGLLQTAVLQKELLIAPGERKDIVIDFSRLEGRRIIITNDANIPFPNGDTVGEGASQIMAFDVTKKLDNSYPLTKVKGVLNKGLLPDAIAALPASDNLKVRKLILFEGEDEYGRLKPMLGTFEEGALDWHEEITENPGLNDTEIWEIYNLTPDAHPVHLHLVSFRVLSSQKFEPLFDTDEDEVVGKISSVSWVGPPMRPERGQQGKKDTYPVSPGEATRLIATFDRPGRYVWHCHILSHEDHEMMRPYYVGEMPSHMLVKQAEEQRVLSLNGEKSFEGGKYSVYPNPFSGTATLNFKMNESATVAVRLFDLSGRMVREVPVKQLPAGQHQLEIDGADLQTGMYMCEVEVNDKLHRSRLLLVK